MRDCVILRANADGWLIVFPSMEASSSFGRKPFDIVVEPPVKMDLTDLEPWFLDLLDEHGSIEDLAWEIAKENEVNQSNITEYVDPQEAT